MQRDQHSRIDLGYLKTEIVKKLGAESSKLYFFYLNRFLSLKITKVEFDKICFRVLGRENVALHNQLITSILRNAYNAKAPPEIHGNEVCKPLDAAADELQQTKSPSNRAQTLHSSLLSNGCVLPPSQGLDEKTQQCVRGLLRAPLGVPLLQARRALALASSGFVSSYDCGGLLGSETLRHCMEQIAVKEGLQGVSLDCANLLNCALDCYLKKLIKASVELAGNGPGSELSLLDFRAAMELNPRHLGEDWPLLLEKVCVYSHRN